MIKIAKLLQNNKVSGKWTSVSLVNRDHYAGIQKILGKEKKAVSGLFSLQEPYGLTPFETAFAGIPCVVSKSAGCLKDFCGTSLSFDPYCPEDIAKSLLNTLSSFDEIRDA